MGIDLVRGMALAAALLATAASVGCKKKGDDAPPVPPAPAPSSVVPPSGSIAGGEPITVFGNTFEVGATVTIDGVACTAVTVNGAGTQIAATTPAGASLGAKQVVVTNASGQTGSLLTGFTYVTAGTQPTISGVAPTIANPSGGTTITITGTNFSTTGTTQVFFGATGSVSVTVTSTTTIVVIVPAGALGSTTVTVVNPSGLAATATGPTYVPGPTITGFTPTTGAYTGGTAVTLTGTDFYAGATVAFGGTPATSVVVVSATSITCVTAGGQQVGQVAIQVTNVDGQFGIRNFPGFVYTGPPPTISAINPTSGPNTGGTLVTITGTNFFLFPTVRFGTSNATSITVVSATTITCLTPSGPATAVNVTVTNRDANTVTATAAYTYTLAPSVFSVTPAAGLIAGGNTVTISGANFVTTGTTTVDVGGSAATSVNVINGTTITCVVPAHAIGLVTVTVTNPNLQQGFKNNAYTYSTTPTLTGISPNSDFTGGGILVTISGTNFVTGATADIGTIPLTNVTITGTTTLTGYTPSSTPGIKTVRVTNPANLPGTFSPFTYRYGPNDQTNQYQWDTSNVNNTNRWLLDFSWPAFTSDLNAKGYQSLTPSDSVNAYAMDWARAYVLRVISLAYGRTATGAKVSGVSVNISFVGIAPAAGNPGGTNSNTDYSRMCIGGTNCSGGGGVVGVAWFDSGTPCGNSAEDDCDGPQFNVTGNCLGVFSGSLGGGVLGTRITQADLPYFDGTGPIDARYNAIHNTIQGWTRAVAFVASHECGHSNGLYGSALTGTCGGASGCGATGSHNSCGGCQNIMKPSLGSTSSDTSQAFSGRGVAASSSCWPSGGNSEWALLSSWFGLSP